MKDRLVVKTTAKEIYKKKLVTRIATIIIAFLLLFLSLIYCVLYIVNTEGNFTISLDPNLRSNQNIVMSPTLDFSNSTLILKAKSLDYMDNISEKWLPTDIDEQEGAHNGSNYIAYTFFIKNKGEETTKYVVSIDIISVIKNVDDAVRVALYTNGEKVVYAKADNATGNTVAGTVEFNSKSQVMYKVRSDFEAGSVDKYTVVVWLEGDDPECVDDILGGEMKLKMSFGEDKN